MEYTDKTLQLLQKQEDLLVFEQFTSEDALEIGSAMVKLSPQYGREVSIQITRNTDGQIIFQYLGNSKTAANVGYMEGKRKACEESGHASAYVYVANQLDHSYSHMFEQFPAYCPSAGAFPVRMDGRLVGVISVSGLHEGKDHELIIRALEEKLNKNTGEFPYQLV